MLVPEAKALVSLKVSTVLEQERPSSS